MITISRTYVFEAAHFLPLVPDGHKCGKMHGHSYEVVIEVTGPIGPMGWIDDFAVIDAVAAPVIASLDHSTLNDQLDNPTSEQLAAWIAGQLGALSLASVEVSETRRSRARWTP